MDTRTLTPPADADDLDTIELTRAIIADGDRRNTYALRVKDMSLVDALINAGDLVIMRRTTSGENGKLMDVWVKSLGERTLRRYYDEGERVRLQPDNGAMEPLYVRHDDIEVRGRVILLIRTDTDDKPKMGDALPKATTTPKPAAAPGWVRGSQPKDARLITEGETEATGPAGERVQDKLTRHRAARGLE